MILQRFGKKAKGCTVPATELCVHHPWQCSLPWLIRAYSSSPEWLCVGVGSVLACQQGILPLALYILLLYKSQTPPQLLNTSWELAAQAHKSTCELRTLAKHAHFAVQLGSVVHIDLLLSLVGSSSHVWLSHYLATAPTVVLPANDCERSLACSAKAADFIWNPVRRICQKHSNKRGHKSKESKTKHVITRSSRK